MWLRDTEPSRPCALVKHCHAAASPAARQILTHSSVSMSAEPVRFPHFVVVNLAREGAASTEAYRNVVVNRVNESCLRLATFEGEYRWHFHPDSDELFVVVDGQLEIDLADGSSLCLHPWDMVTIPAGVVHRTRAVGRTINITFEHMGAGTTFVDGPAAGARADRSRDG